MKKRSNLILGSLSLFPVLFLTYCFFPYLTYDTKYSQHVNHFPSESLAPGRILLTDRNGEIITDKMYPNGYYRPLTQSQLPLNTVDGSLPLSEGELKESPSEREMSEGQRELGLGNGKDRLKQQLNTEFVQALIRIEDKNYYDHWGVNVPSKFRALRDNILGKKVSGGSTITEQYVKNKYFKTHKRSYLQKARESVMAFSINATRKKDKVLNIYYHDAYFGNNLYGVGAALEVYFNKESLDELTQEEIVILLSLIHNPGIQTLEETYFQNYFEQVKTRLGYDFERTYFGKLPRKENLDRFPFVTQSQLPLNHVNGILPLSEGELKASFGEGGVRRTEGAVVVTIDARLQDFAREILQQTLEELKDKNVTNGAIFAMNPRTREVFIYQGSKDFHAKDIEGQVDVIKAFRQPGSTMKPFLYLLALESGAGQESLLIDVENQYNSFQEGKTYVSENYSLKEHGLVRLKKALGNSFNNASVRLAKELGLQQVYEFYEKYGFSFPHGAEHYGYSLVLGNPSITLESLVHSYSRLLPNMTPPVFVNSDIPLYEGELKESPSKREMSEGQREQSKFLLYDILSDPDNRDVSFGVNSILNTSIPQAVKTGTSSDFRDNLVISYHPDLVVGVWIGNNDNSSMKGVTGITGAGYVWHHIIEKSIELGYITDVDIPIPEGIELSKYCLDTNCIRKELNYQRGEQEYFSRLADNIFDEKDMFEEIDGYEKKKLEELGIHMR